MRSFEFRVFRFAPCSAAGRAVETAWQAPVKPVEKGQLETQNPKLKTRNSKNRLLFPADPPKTTKTFS
jgi:hypothetical protein